MDGVVKEPSATRASADRRASEAGSSGPRRVLTVISSRAEYSRIVSVLRGIEERDDLELVLIVAGQVPLRRHGLALQVMRDDGFEPDEIIYQTIEGENAVTMGRTVGLTIIDSVGMLARHRPDWLLIMGDRFEALALAVAGAMSGVRMAHVQGGEVTGSVDESTRHAITKFAQLHFPSTERAAEVIRRLGEPPDRVFVTGCPSVDLLARIEPDGRETALGVLRPILKVPMDLDSELPLAMVIFHPNTTREESQGAEVAELTAALEGLEATRAIFWPNIDAGADRVLDSLWRFQRQHLGDDTVVYLNNFDPMTFLTMLANADVLVGNSSSGIREACYFGTPVVNVGDRQQGRLRPANVVDVPVQGAAIREAIERQLGHGRYAPEHAYGEPGAGRAIAELLATQPLPDVQKTIHYPDLVGPGADGCREREPGAGEG